MITDSPQSLPELLRLRTLLALLTLSLWTSFTAKATAEQTESPAALNTKFVHSSELKQAIAAKRQKKTRTAKLSTSKAPSRISPGVKTLMTRADDRQALQVYVQLKTSTPDDIALLKSLGVDVELVNTELHKVQARVQVQLLQALSEMENVLAILPAVYGEPRQGSVITQGDRILTANLLRQLGYRGQGVKVGVVSDGANNWTTARNSGNLPTTLKRYGSCQTRAANQADCRSARTCNEGTAMAEIIHDLAPDAQLAVAAANTSLEFIQSIQQLANDFKADVIVDDLGFFGEPYFADGDIAKAVQALPKHVLYVSAAGNSGATHYTADFVSANTAGGDLHDFAANPDSSTDDAMGFVLAGRRGAFALLQWDDPFDNAQSDFDLYISSQTALVAFSAEDNTTPFEATCVYNPSPDAQVYFAQVDKYSGADKQLKMYLLGAGQIEYPMRKGSIFGHPGTQRAIAVGSINADEAGNDNIAYYSSGGPTNIVFPRSESRRKPDVVAIDGVQVSGAGGFSSPFYGTSAAAPHVAGIAALLMSAHRDASAQQIRVALTRSAKDLGTAGFDSTYGNGIVDALAAFNTLPLANPAPFIMLLLGDEEKDK